MQISVHEEATNRIKMAELLRYSYNEISVRELIAEVSAALFKICYESITNQEDRGTAWFLRQDWSEYVWVAKRGTKAFMATMAVGGDISMTGQLTQTNKPRSPPSRRRAGPWRTGGSNQRQAQDDGC